MLLRRMQNNGLINDRKAKIEELKRSRDKATDQPDLIQLNRKIKEAEFEINQLMNEGVKTKADYDHELFVGAYQHINGKANAFSYIAVAIVVMVLIIIILSA